MNSLAKIAKGRQDKKNAKNFAILGDLGERKLNTMTNPLLNITMPVFNRPVLTELSILTLRAKTQGNFALTVVDNGSDEETQKLLLFLKKKKYIDYLYRLEKNYGVALAANIGWRLMNAPIYMKIDNDIETLSKNWNFYTSNILKNFDYNIILGADFHNQLHNKNHVREIHDDIGRTCAHVSGGAILIPKVVSDTAGYWCEDYGIYGCEDGDYGVRLEKLGIKQYYFNHKSFFAHRGNKDESIYKKYHIKKKKIQEFYRQYFATNSFLIANGFKNPNICPKFKIIRFDKYILEVTISKYWHDLWKNFSDLHTIILEENESDDYIDKFKKQINRFVTVHNREYAILQKDVHDSYIKYEIK